MHREHAARWYVHWTNSGGKAVLENGTTIGVYCFHSLHCPSVVLIVWLAVIVWIAGNSHVMSVIVWSCYEEISCGRNDSLFRPVLAFGFRLCCWWIESSELCLWLFPDIFHGYAAVLVACVKGGEHSTSSNQTKYTGKACHKRLFATGGNRLEQYEPNLTFLFFLTETSKKRKIQSSLNTWHIPL